MKRYEKLKQELDQKLNELETRLEIEEFFDFSYELSQMKLRIIAIANELAESESEK